LQGRGEAAHGLGWPAKGELQIGHDGVDRKPQGSV
jgi:hypothetical protein